MTTRPTAPVFAGLRFPPQVITAAVRWYLRYGLPCWDVEELLADRSVTVDHVTIYRRVRRFTPEFIEAARPRRHAPGDRWFAGETILPVQRPQASAKPTAVDNQVGEHVMEHLEDGSVIQLGIGGMPNAIGG